MLHFAKPENALKRAEELCAVGQRDAALVGMYDVLSSKRHRTWQPAMELVMTRYLELCVEMRRAKAAKDGLIQYRMVCQQVNVGSMETVLRKFMDLADKAATDAFAKAEAITGMNAENLLDIGDLEAEETPESLMMATVGGFADSKKRTDRQVVTPSLKFLWETYRSVLDVLRNNTKLDELYRDTCLRAFGFCQKYKRQVEFRRLCEILRNHIQSQTKVDPKWKDKEPLTPEAMQTHLETRFSQLATAIEMKLWQEAYRTVEDVHAMLAIMPLRPKAKPMATYHAQLAKVFWVAGNTLFHSMSLIRLYNLSKTFATQPSASEMEAHANRAVLAVLATPLDPPVADVNLLEYDLEHEKVKRMASMLSFPTDISRSLLLAELKRCGVLDAASEEVKALHSLTEATFFPLDVCDKARPLIEGLVASPGGACAQYDGALRRLVGVRILQQMERVYLTVKIESVVKAIGVLTWPEIVDLILWAAKRELITLRIDERAGEIRQASAQASAAMSLEVRDTLSKFGAALEAVSARLNLAELKNKKDEKRRQLYTSFQTSLKEEHEKILERRGIIERRKEEAERLATEEEKERTKARKQALAELEADEKSKLDIDRSMRAANKEQKERDEAEAASMRELAEKMAEQRKNMKVTKKKVDEDGKKVETSVDELAKKDKAELMKEQRELVLDERVEFETRLTSMAKRHDHLERARREEERKLLQAAWEKQQESDKKAHEEQSLLLKAQMKENRANDLKEKTRFSRMSEAVATFQDRVLASRRVAHEAVVVQVRHLPHVSTHMPTHVHTHHAHVHGLVSPCGGCVCVPCACFVQWRIESEQRKEEMRLEKERVAAEEREREEMLEAARREAEEEEARRIQEAAEAARKKAEAEEERKRVEEKQRLREKEIEEKRKKEVLEKSVCDLPISPRDLPRISVCSPSHVALHDVRTPCPTSPLVVDVSTTRRRLGSWSAKRSARRPACARGQWMTTRRRRRRRLGRRRPRRRRRPGRRRREMRSGGRGISSGATAAAAARATALLAAAIGGSRSADVAAMAAGAISSAATTAAATSAHPPCVAVASSPVASVATTTVVARAVSSAATIAAARAAATTAGRSVVLGSSHVASAATTTAVALAARVAARAATTAARRSVVVASSPAASAATTARAAARAIAMVARARAASAIALAMATVAVAAAAIPAEPRGAGRRREHRAHCRRPGRSRRCSRRRLARCVAGSREPGAGLTGVFGLGRELGGMHLMVAAAGGP